MIDFLLHHTPLLYLTQSLWRDEAFSVLLAGHSVIDIIRLSAGDFTPPLYYLLLHFWIIIFGQSEVVIRLLSFMFHVATCVVAFKLILHYFSKKSTYNAGLLSLFVFFNPMLLYYAFEARMYSMLVFLLLLTIYFLLKKSWKRYLLFSILALYTHPYALFALFSQGVWIVLHRKSDIGLFSKILGVAILSFSPWAVVLLLQIVASGETWYFPVNKDLIQSVLGNLFLGYEGTPFEFFVWSRIISAVILFSTVIALYHKFIQKQLLLILYSAYIPLIIVLGISQFSPIYVNRYLIYVSVFLTILVGYSMLLIPSKLIQRIIIIVVFVGLLWYQTWIPPYIQKVAFRDTFHEINKTYITGDLIVSSSFLTFFESIYYSNDKNAVYVYNPKNTSIPSYVGLVLIPEAKIIQQIPDKSNAYLIQDNGTFIKIINK